MMILMSSMEKQRLSAEIILCKNNASESNESLFSDCRAQPVFKVKSDIRIGIN